ncbi:hypothetical protein CBM2606_A60087 [Cupriavidus taiwanensis]|nr:hypothetical protein CBM2606_A60087 [Cupriavidus taiwanensis]
MHGTGDPVQPRRFAADRLNDGAAAADAAAGYRSWRLQCTGILPTPSLPLPHSPPA